MLENCWLIMVQMYMRRTHANIRRFFSPHYTVIYYCPLKNDETTNLINLILFRLGHPSLAKLLISSGVNVNEEKYKLGFTPLHVAALAGKTTAKNENHWHLIANVCFWIGQKDMIALLLANNASASVRSEDNLTPCDVVHSKSEENYHLIVIWKLDFY